MSNNSNPRRSPPPPLVSIDVASQLPIKFTGANYSSWRRQFHSLLVGYGLQGFIDGTITRPPLAASLAHRHWIQQDQRLFHAIMASVNEETIVPLIESSPSARDAWLSLERFFASRSRSHRMELMDKLSGLKHHHDKNQSVFVYLTSLKRVANDLALIGHPVEDPDLVLHALNGVGSEFKEIVAAIRARDAPISFEELFDELVEFEKLMQRKDANLVVCQYCDQPGHSAKTCHRIINTAATPNNDSSSSWLLFDSAVTQQITNALRNLSLPQFNDGPNSLINNDGSETNYTKGALTVVVLLLQPILLLFKLLFGRTPNILNASSRTNNIIPSPASALPSISHSGDHSKDAPIPQQSNDHGIASASDSVLSLPRGEHEVFLSFRGPDTRQVFTNTLFILLKHLNIRTFMDDEKLEKGEEIWPSLVAGIRQSKVHVAILSEKYVESKWCLRELAEFVECRKQDKGHIIIPIFYMVDPRDVRHQTGPYQSAFQRHEQMFNAKIVQAWRDALNLVGTIKGWHVGSKDKPGEIADNVCNDIWLHIRNNDKFWDRDGLVGIDEHIRVITNTLSLDNEGVTMVGLHGFGGIGKTTIARAVYNQISSQFDRCSFLENIRETQEQKNGTISLQHKLISNIVLRMDSVGSINEVIEGKKLIKDRVSLFKVLIVLDDVDEKFIFEDVIGNLGDFASGSRFIITSRDVNVLSTFNKSRCKLHEVGEMNAQFSLELFCKHAFKKNCPSQEYETLSQDIVSIAGGLPLFLEVVGRLLYGQAKEIWEDRLEQLRKVSVRGVSERLKISYNALEYEAQQIFLDIACFYVNMNKEKPTYMWIDLKLFPITNINVLVQRSMIKIGDDNQFQMHDQLRDMGRAIVHEENIEEPCMRSRIWDTEESVDLLRNKKGSKQVKALYADFSLEPQKPLEAEHFLNLPELRYLEAERLDFVGDFNNLVSNLRWLRLQSCVCDSSNQFNNFRMANMVILDLQDSIFVEGDLGCWSQIKMANKLKVVDLSGCSGLTKLPDFPQSGCLELLHLSNVVGGSLGSATLSMELDIKNLWNLQVLDLSKSKLKMIKGGTIGLMKKLQELDLTEIKCENLTEVLVDIDQLSSLTILKTIRANQDPDDSSSLRKRNDEEELSLARVPTTLKALHTSSKFVNLSELLELEEITIEDCDYGLQIPLADQNNAWWEESKLEVVSLTRTKIVVAKTSTTKLPTSLTSLRISDCPEMTWLPTLENLTNLVELGIEKCPSLGEIQGLENLLRSSNLERLVISSCPLLKSPFHGGDGLKNDSSIKELCVRKCGYVMIPPLSNFPRLEILEIGDITTNDNVDQQGLESRMEEIGGLKRLERLLLLDLPSIYRLPSLSKLKDLITLIIVNMSGLREIQGLSELNSLEQLQLVLCMSLERLILPAAGFKRLKELDIRGCKNLAPRDLSALGEELLNVNIRWPDEECIRYGEGPSFFMDDPLESMCTMQ